MGQSESTSIQESPFARSLIDTKWELTRVQPIYMYESTDGSKSRSVYLNSRPIFDRKPSKPSKKLEPGAILVVKKIASESIEGILKSGWTAFDCKLNRKSTWTRGDLPCFLHHSMLVDTSNSDYLMEPCPAWNVDLKKI